MALAGDDQGVEDRRALAGVGLPDKKPVLLADVGHSQRLLNEIIVEAAVALMQERREVRPLGEQVVAGLAEGGPGQDPLPGVQGDPPAQSASGSHTLRPGSNPGGGLTPHRSPTRRSHPR